MNLPSFKLERYFAQWEFSAPYSLCSSDVQGYPMHDLIALADDECCALWHNLMLGYTESLGLPLLRTAIANLYNDQDASAENILTFAGAEEAIFTLMNVFVQPGDHVIVTWPGYQSLHEIARSCGGDVTFIPLRSDAGWELDITELHHALRPTTRLIVTNFPHNPTGWLPSRETFDALVSLVEASNAYWLSDEVYRLLEYNLADRLPPAYVCTPKAISLGVLSKAFGMAGLRIGWVATRDSQVLHKAAAFKDYLSICNSAPSEILALMALRQHETVLARSHAIIARNLELLDDFFARVGDACTWVRPRAGSVAFPQIICTRTIEHYATDLVEQQGVLILPGTCYDYPGNHFRIGFGRTDMPEALERFERFLLQWIQKP